MTPAENVRIAIGDCKDFRSGNRPRAGQRRAGTPEALGGNTRTAVSANQTFVVTEVIFETTPQDKLLDDIFDEILEKAKELTPNVVGLSALLTTSMPQMQKTVAFFKQSGMNYPVIVCGAPVTWEFADVIGADGCGENAPHAVETVHGLVAIQLRDTA